MQSDVFRFIALREPVKPAPGDDVVIESSSDSGPTPLLRRLEEARRSEAPREALAAVARAHAESPEYVRRLSDAAPALDAVARQITSARGDVDPDVVRKLLTAAAVSSSALGSLQNRISDSLLAAILSGDTRRADGAELERGLRALIVARRAADDAAVTREALKEVYRRPVALPEPLFPVPTNNAAAEAKAAAGFQEDQAKQLALKGRVKELTERLEANSSAVAELTKAYRDDNAAKRLEGDRLAATRAAAAPQPSPGLGTRILRRLGLAPGPAPENPGRSAAGPAIPALDANIAASLSADTVKRLSAIGRSTTSLNVPEAITHLDADSTAAADALYRGGASGAVTRIGGTFVNIRDVIVVADPGRPSRVPGVCSPGEVESPTLNQPSVPESVGLFHSLGVADLLVVRQKLLRYEMGEIAHVENVMAKELRKRVHRGLNRREELRLTESERIEEKERDLESTERFELQNESQKTIEENASRQAGVTITASYGPSVEVSANASYSSTTSKSESNRIASSHARELTERSVQRVQERVRELRSVLTVSETEEVNEHTFNNTTSTHVVGVYRWLDKIYQAQVFDYGKREILEFVVPEPAAFVRHAAANKPAEGVTLERPEPPGYCSSQQATFTPLEPKDITRTSYLLWTARYKVQKVSPPPARFRVVATAFDQPWIADNPKATAASNKELKVPDGYVARRAWTRGNHAHYTSDVSENRVPQLKIYVGRHELDTQASATLDGENEIVPIGIIGILLLVFAVTVEVECELTEEALAKWQLETYTAVMNAYDELRAAYEQQVKATEESAADVTVRGRNPAQNRAVERTELKRAVISQMTGQHFDLFDAMRRSVQPHGFPQADLNEAFAEGEYIRFVEQAFEWENILYLFYPYFWGRKDRWPLVSQLDDPDPIYTEFLKAGAARVNVPVRPGFESAVNGFLSTGLLPWKTGSESTITPKEPFLSIADEIKSQQGAIHTKSGGTIDVTAGSADVAGEGTEFNEDDENREITIRGEVYRIKSVASATQLTLTRAFAGATSQDVGYVIGAKAVGEPWTLRLPTSLVMLQDDHSLPEFAAQD